MRGGLTLDKNQAGMFMKPTLHYLIVLLLTLNFATGGAAEDGPAEDGPAEDGPAEVAAAGTVRVYILAGQSNMEGKAQNKLWNHQAQAPGTQEFFAHLRKDDQWVVRDDVFIKFLNRKGPLTLGYGSRDRTGAEFEFGYVLGEHYAEPVLLIKTAWGGHSLYKNFRSPSNPPPATLIDKELEQRIARTKAKNEKKGTDESLPTREQVLNEYGQSYRNMMTEVGEVLDNYETLFPELRGKELKLSGFFWFQGWNDQYNDAQVEYADNMRQFIKDCRTDLAVPDLPFVIAVMGQNQSNEPKGPMKTIQEAQLAMQDAPEFKGTVRAVRTDVLVDKAAEKLYTTWRDNLEQWEKTGSDHPYHYLGSAIWYTRIGRACAEAMIGLEQSASAR